MLRRHPTGPILTRDDLPDVAPEIVDATSVFNPGAILDGERTVLLLRVQTRGRRTHFLRATSADGTAFDVEPCIVRVTGLDRVGATVHHVYDARLTRIGSIVHVVVAMDTDDGCRLGVARWEEPHRLDLIDLVSGDDQRNGVLFPERIDGRWLMLSRPNRTLADGVAGTGDAIVLLESDDLATWREVGPVMAGRWHYWDELIGAGPPPVKTRDGWLLVYHGVATHLATAWIYQAGAALLDLDDPTRVLARTRDNVLEPREIWETVGQVPNVVFPSGLVADDVDDEGFARRTSPLRVYYGAADTSVGLARTTVSELTEACHER